MKRKIIILVLIISLSLMFSVTGLAFVSPLSSSSGVLTGKIIILDPGHGADTTNYHMGYCEHTAMLALARKIKPLLEDRGATVHLTRSTDDGVLLSTRVAMSNILSLNAIKYSMVQNAADEDILINDLNEIDRLIGIMHSIIKNPEDYAAIYFNTPFSPLVPIHPDLERIFKLQSDPMIGERFLFISLHTNATSRPIDTTVHGADVFHISNNIRSMTDYFSNYSFVDQSARFGEIILDHINNVGIQKRTVSQSNYFVIREHNIPAVLVENGHHTSPYDRAILMSDFFLERLAYAYLDAITAYFTDPPLPPIPPKPFDPLDLRPPWLRPLSRFFHLLDPDRPAALSSGNP